MAINREVQMDHLDKSVHDEPLLNVNMIECKTCLMVFRIERLTSKLRKGLYQHCPMCGGTEIITNHGGWINDRWYHMAGQFGLRQNERAVELLKELMKIWEPTEFEYFKDFVRSVLDSRKKKEA